jgi:hypothetical protein
MHGHRPAAGTHRSFKVGLRGLRAKFSIADEGGDVRQRDGFREELRDAESTGVTDVVRVLSVAGLVSLVSNLQGILAAP